MPTDSAASFRPASANRRTDCKCDRETQKNDMKYNVNYLQNTQRSECARSQCSHRSCRSGYVFYVSVWCVCLHISSKVFDSYCCVRGICMDNIANIFSLVQRARWNNVQKQNPRKWPAGISRIISYTAKFFSNSVPPPSCSLLSAHVGRIHLSFTSVCFIHMCVRFFCVRCWCCAK